MHDKADQTVLLHDAVYLVAPEVKRASFQNMEQRVILSGGDGQFQDVPDEVRHYGAAPARLRVEMSDVGHRHIVGESESVIPLQISIQNAGAESAASKPERVFVNA